MKNLRQFLYVQIVWQMIITVGPAAVSRKFMAFATLDNLYIDFFIVSILIVFY